MDAALILKKQNDDSFTGFIKESIQRSGMTENPRILVLGSHNGKFASSLSDIGQKIVGVDKDSELVRFANANFSHNDLNFFNYDICTNEIYFDEKFDLIIDYHTSHCITGIVERKHYFDFVKNHLKSDGLYLSESMCIQKNMVLPYDYFLVNNVLSHMDKPIRFLTDSFYIENELISNALDICYFYHLPSFHFNIFDMSEVAIEKTPSLLRINCRLKNESK